MLLDLQQQGVAVTVQTRAHQILSIPGRGAFAPQ
ncbi:MAG: Uncharacterised protein [Halieaceae bacterium]|nr:MAG: Uncharacterised protein [Halieaceae bacterium]